MKGTLITFLKTDTTLTGLVSDIVSHPAGQNVSLSYVTVQRLTDDPESTISTAADYSVSTWQLNVYASTDLAAEAIYQAIKDKIHICGPQSTTPYTIEAATVTGAVDSYEWPDDDGQEYTAIKFVTIKTTMQEV